MNTDLQSMLGQSNAAWKSHDVERLASFFTDDCVYEDVAFGRVNHGKEELKAYLHDTFAAFPDFKTELKSFFISGDLGGIEWVMSGTHKGDIPGLPATDKSFSVRGASIIEVHEGKIKRQSDYYDMASLLRQLGVMPVSPPS